MKIIYTDVGEYRVYHLNEIEILIKEVGLDLAACSWQSEQGH